MTQTAPILAPFWSDDFDMDLLKVLPSLPAELGAAANIELVTQGGESFGRLNHPSVWHTDRGLAAFFGFQHPGIPAGYYADRPEVRCTWLEVLRDAWPHSYLVIVERHQVWNTGALQKVFDDLMWGIRGWHDKPAQPFEAFPDLVTRVRTEVLMATDRIRALARQTFPAPGVVVR